MLVPHSLRSLRHFFLFGLLLLLFGAFALPHASTASVAPLGGPNPVRPLDYTFIITGTHTIGDVVEFTHPLGPDPASLHPVWVYSEDRNTLWGVGKYAADFSELALPRPFGTGIDGDLIVPSGQISITSTVRTTISASGTSANPTNSDGFNEGDVVLFHQSHVTSSVGRWEYNVIATIDSPTSWTLVKPLLYTYDSINGGAQAIRVPQYQDVLVSGTLMAPDWDRTKGGILVFMATGSVNITGSGRIDATGLGYQVYQYVATGGGTQQFPGEGYLGQGGQTSNNIGNGGGGGRNETGDNAYNAKGGGGGGHSTTGGSSWGIGGATIGESDLTQTIFFGGAGGHGGHDWRVGNGSVFGGDGGGSVIVSAGSIEITGDIAANGENGRNQEGGFGGGAGGSVFLNVGRGELGDNNVQAIGGLGGVGRDQNGGNGGEGRIHIRHCGSISGTTLPTAYNEPVDCYIISQVETPPYSTTQLTLTESFTDTRTYNIQFGRRFPFQSGSEQLKIIRVPVGAWTNVTLDALLSDFTAGSATFQLDIGNNGTWDWQPSAVNEATILPSINLASAFTTYWQEQGSPPSGTLDVPVRVGFSAGGQVILTNLEMVPVNATPTPTNTASPSATRTPTITNTPTIGPSPTPTHTSTAGPSPTATSTNTPGPSPTATTTHTPAPTITNTPTRTPTQSVPDRTVYVPLVLRQYGFVTPVPTPTPIPCLTNEIEPNDSFGAVAQHPLLCRNQSINGTFVETTPPAAPDDFYRFQVTSTGNLVVQLNSIAAGCDFDLELYDGLGNRIGFSYSSGNANESIPYTAQPGMYYVRVYRRTGFSSQPYIVGWQ